MTRHGRTDDEFDAIRHLLPKQPSDRPGRCWIDHRSVIDGILWIAKTGMVARSSHCRSTNRVKTDSFVAVDPPR
ncbi:transposase [Rubripirellula reticaptiva]|uniref:transposase n=1 Tax=Rubripirellula reticaptiva TaxID=2528013 RepID=UPI0011B5511A